MPFLKENLKDSILSLDESIVFLINVTSNELINDAELVKEAKKHIRNLATLHDIIIEEAEAVL
jgi:hypothetical protein